MSINVFDFLLKNSSGKSSYAIVKYASKEEAIFFVNHHSMDYGIGFVGKPCYLHKIYFGQDPDKFCKHYAENIIGTYNKEATDKYIKEKIIPYIKDNVFYLIDTPSVEPFLPENVEEIRLISKLDCIDWLIKREK